MNAAKKSERTENAEDMAAMPPVSVFDTMISELPQTFKDEITETDHYLKSMRPLKFKRTIDKKAKKITYVASDHGVSYMFRISGDKLTHNFQWYIVTSGKPETWHRRADYMEETLAKIAENDLSLATRIYHAFKICPGSDNCYGERCLARTPYAFHGQRQLTCHGGVELAMRRDDFHDAREFFRYANQLVEEKITGGEVPEKIYVCRTKRSL